MKKYLILGLLAISFGMKAYSWKVINRTYMPLKVNADTSLAGAHFKSHKFSGKFDEEHSYTWGGIHVGACFKRLKIYNKHGKKIETINLREIKAGRSRSAEWSGCSNAKLYLHRKANGKIIADIKGAVRY